MRSDAGVPPALERAFCPCRFTAKLAMPTTRGQNNLGWCWRGELNPHAG